MSAEKLRWPVPSTTSYRQHFVLCLPHRRDPLVLGHGQGRAVAIFPASRSWDVTLGSTDGHLNDSRLSTRHRLWGDSEDRQRHGHSVDAHSGAPPSLPGSGCLSSAAFTGEVNLTYDQLNGGCTGCLPTPMDGTVRYNADNRLIILDRTNPWSPARSTRR